MKTQKDPSLSPLSVCFSIGVSMETSREGGTGDGVAMGTDWVCEYLARRASAPCALPPEAFGTSLAALCLWPVAERQKRRQRGG